MTRNREGIGEGGRREGEDRTECALPLWAWECVSAHSGLYDRCVCVQASEGCAPMCPAHPLCVNSALLCLYSVFMCI